MASITETLRTDIAHIGDLLATPAGDLDTVSGLANLKAALFHRLLTVPGSLIHRPTYGVGITMYENAPNSFTLQQKLAMEIREQFMQDDRVAEVLGVRIDSSDSNPALNVLVVRVKPVGYDEQEMQFTPFNEGV